VPEAVPPVWSVGPFAAYLLAIALVPLVASRFWERNRNKLLVAVLASLPTLVYLLGVAPTPGATWLWHSAREYAAFLALLGALFAISGGIHLRGSLAGTPLVNSAVLGLGAVLASVLGTTGASVLLIRPLLRANAARLVGMARTLIVTGVRLPGAPALRRRLEAAGARVARVAALDGWAGYTVDCRQFTVDSPDRRR